eukprot:415688_1
MSVLGKRKAKEMDSKNTDNSLLNNTKRHKLNSNNNTETKQDIQTINKNTKKKKTHPPSKGHRMEKIPSYYFFINGYRYIAPYKFEYRCFAKGRWFNREIYEVMTTEFVAYDKTYYKNAIINGKILVRDEKVALNYMIQNGDWITHFIHRHEPPILNLKIDIIYENNDIMVINKPSGMAIHPCGKYRHNTLIYILYNELNKELFSAHRLDRVTSGLMLLCKNKQTAQKIGEKIRSRDMRKVYLARVKGQFTYGNNNNDEQKTELIRVNQAIRCKNHQKGVHEIHVDGKEAITDFKFISFDGKSSSSLIECYPKTGRTHQIRLHLQYLGYPIINDFAYGGKEYNISHWIPENNDDKSKLIDEVKKHWNDDCDECKTVLQEINGEKKDARNSAPEIYLHALKYECDEFSYTVPKPYWA